jgi:hypothetical protein
MGEDIWTHHAVHLGSDFHAPGRLPPSFDQWSSCGGLTAPEGQLRWVRDERRVRAANWPLLRFRVDHSDL